MNIVRIWFLVLGLGIAGCAVNPVTGDHDLALFTESEEIEQGRQYHKTILAQYGTYDDPELQQYVDNIGQQLAAKSHRAHLKFTFTVLDSPDINAFALPGGYIYVTRGIMAYLGSEAELAGVLGHEIGHVTARHFLRQQAGKLATSLLGVLIAASTGSGEAGKLTDIGISRSYGRDHELEADRLGAEYLHKIGYDPESMLEVIGVLKDQGDYEKALAKKENRKPSTYHGLFATHPRNDDRLKTVVRAAKKYSSQNYRDSNQKGYYEKIDDIAWGPSIRQGAVTDNLFEHPDLAFSIRLPATWQIRNNAQYLKAVSPQSKAVVQLGVTMRKQNESLDALLLRLTKKSDLPVHKQAYGVTAKINIKSSAGDSQPARISAIALDDQQVLTLLGTSIKEQFSKTDPLLIAINSSFKRLTAIQVEAIKVPRLQILEAHNQSGFASLAQHSAIKYDAESILRLLNRAFPQGDIKSLKLLKTVTIEK